MSSRRCLCWSITRDKLANIRSVRAQGYRNYPGQGATRPVDMYVWAPVEVASPVFRFSADARPLIESLTVICDALKYRFHTHHRAMPTLDLTTSIFIGHTEGFTLLELKKLVTLWLALEHKPATLRWQRRAFPGGCWPCGSRLGALVAQPLHDPLNIMPYPSDETREFFTKADARPFQRRGSHERGGGYRRTVSAHRVAVHLRLAARAGHEDDGAAEQNVARDPVRRGGGVIGHRTGHPRADTTAGADKPFLGIIDRCSRGARVPADGAKSGTGHHHGAGEHLRQSREGGPRDEPRSVLGIHAHGLAQRGLGFHDAWRR
ncbi:hypothetical protein F4861DRAFT_523035 [Xylaria intraflava]|nr:hypothetical protein F4861DRAFT_523035 [Xylaria intraflava]